MIKTLAELVEIREAARPTIVGTVNGVLDILHAGHIEAFEEMRQHCGFLICLLNSDASARRLNKGPGRPFMSEQERAAIIGGLRAVDAVGIFDGDDPSAEIEALRPDVHFLGSEYKNTESKEYRLRPIPEREPLERHGGRLVFLEGAKTPGSTGIVQRILAAHQLAPPTP